MLARLSLLAAAAAIFLAGCGGGGGQSGHALAGRYSGTFTGDSVNWTTEIIVSSDGAVSGTIHDVDRDADGAVVGNVTENGAITGTTQFPPVAARTFGGQLVRTNNGLTGGISYTDTVELALTLIRR